jgi:hypothetical protein
MIALVLAASVALEPHPELRRGLAEGHERTEAHRQESLRRHQSRERLKKDLRYVAEELDRERLGERRALAEHSAGCLARLAHLKKDGRLDRRLYDPAESPQDPDKVIPRLEKLCAELPSKTYAESYPRSLLKAVATELREAAELDEAQALAVLKENLALPEQQAGEEDASSALALFPTDVPLAKFKKLGAIRIFLVKHRLRRPKSHVLTTADAITEGRHLVQAGVDITGTVLRHSSAIDGDYCFDIGNLHVEITPEWRLTHPNLPKPKKGDTVRVRGWTYFDIFHKAEPEYDPEDPFMGANRWTQWELHPAQDIEIVSAGGH